MTEEEKREKVISALLKLLETTPFTVELRAKKKPQGVKIIYEVTQEQMDAMLEKPNNKN